MLPSSICGKNSVPSRKKTDSPSSIMTIAAMMVCGRCLCRNEKALSAKRFTSSRKRFFFSLTFLLSKSEDKTGTKVRVKTSAPSKAKPRVKANGENILPSTFWNEKMGMSAVMMMSLAKATLLAFSRAVCLMAPVLLQRLKAAMPISRARSSSMTKSASTITTAPSMMMPKSMAPSESRLAFIPKV